jgi:hypothetical protein
MDVVQMQTSLWVKMETVHLRTFVVHLNELDRFECAPKWFPFSPLDITAVCYNLATKGMHKYCFVTKLDLLSFNDMGTHVILTETFCLYLWKYLLAV